MANVNIPRDVKDEFYRYKMPAIIAKVEGRGNGIKTVIVNMAQVAKSLERTPDYPTKYFGFELGAITTIEPENDKYIVNGKHDQSKLASVLDDFIEKFVLCKQCGRNPETTMHIRQGAIVLKCKACGGRSPVDMRHKLCTYILKNPPGSSGAPAEKKSSKGKKSSKADEDEGDPPIEGEEKLPRSSSKRSKKRDEEEDDGVVWYTDTSKEAAETRRKAMLDDTSELAAKLLSTGIAPETPRQNPVERLSTFIEKERTNDEIIAQVQTIKTEDQLDNELTAKCIMMSIFDKDVLKQIPARLDVLKKFLSDPKSNPGTLGGVVELCGVKVPALLKNVPHVLKALYDEDLLTEEAILKWAQRRTKDETSKAVKEAAKVFVEWLENADEESEEEESDNEEA